MRLKICYYYRFFLHFEGVSSTAKQKTAQHGSECERDNGRRAECHYECNAKWRQHSSFHPREEENGQKTGNDNQS